MVKSGVLTTLVVDDNPDDRFLLKHLFAQKMPEIHVTHEAESVDEAYAIINETRPQLVILDLELPGENGLELLKRFQRPLPFEYILLTGRPMDVTQIFPLRPLHVIMKPAREADFRSAIENLGRSEQVGNQSPCEKMVMVMTELVRKRRSHRLEDYSFLVKKSPAYIRKCIKNVTGTSPIRFRNRILVQEAEDLLRSTGYTVSEVADMLGFDNLSYFDKLFRQETGVSPKTFRSGPVH